MSQHNLSVEGLRCAHCVQILERNLRRLPGVRRVEVRPSSEDVEVEVDPRLVGEAALYAAVRDSGLHVHEEHRELFMLDEPEGEGEGEGAATGHPPAVHVEETEPGAGPPPLPDSRAGS